MENCIRSSRTTASIRQGHRSRNWLCRVLNPPELTGYFHVYIYPNESLRRRHSGARRLPHEYLADKAVFVHSIRICGSLFKAPVGFIMRPCYLVLWCGVFATFHHIWATRALNFCYVLTLGMARRLPRGENKLVPCERYGIATFFV